VGKVSWREAFWPGWRHAAIPLQAHSLERPCRMFEKSEMDTELHARLKAAGLNPLDPAVRAVNDVVSAYYAEKTAKVLQQVQDVLSRLTAQ